MGRRGRSGPRYARGVNYPQSSWHLELVAVAESDHLWDLGLLGASVGDHVAQRAGEPDVVRVGVGQHDRFDVIDRAAHLGQGGLQGVAVSTQAGIDESDLAVLLEHEEVHKLRSQRADHRQVLLCEPEQVAVVGWASDTLRGEPIVGINAVVTDNQMGASSKICLAR